MIIEGVLKSFAEIMDYKIESISNNESSINLEGLGHLNVQKFRNEKILLYSKICKIDKSNFKIDDFLRRILQISGGFAIKFPETICLENNFLVLYRIINERDFNLSLFSSATETFFDYLDLLREFCKRNGQTLID